MITYFSTRNMIFSDYVNILPVRHHTSGNEGLVHLITGGGGHFSLNVLTFELPLKQLQALKIHNTFSKNKINTTSLSSIQS